MVDMIKLTVRDCIATVVKGRQPANTGKKPVFEGR
jgi:hypothetical protein